MIHFSTTNFENLPMILLEPGVLATSLVGTFVEPTITQISMIGTPCLRVLRRGYCLGSP